MRPPIVPGSELRLARSELDEWRRRAESKLGEGDSPARPDRPARRASLTRKVGSVVTASMVTASVALGALSLPGRTHSASPDYPACIGKARYENPIDGNMYQELVNALYSCGVYRLP
jgi:hypothetical protein